MKLTPASIAAWTTALVFWRSSRVPKLLHPRPSAETARPVPPNARLIIGLVPWLPLARIGGFAIATQSSRKSAREELFGKVAGHLASVDQSRAGALFAAPLAHMGAAGREYATLRRVERRRQLALRNAVRRSPAQSGRRCEQRLGIGMK